MRRLLPVLATALGVVGLLALGDPGARANVAAGLLVAWGVTVWACPPRFDRPIHVVFAALLVRAPMLLLPPTLSDDVWRYVWEGEVWRAGFNPFEHAPSSTALLPLRDAVWSNVNHRDVPSIYPPFAQLLFVLLAGGGVYAWRVVSSLADIGTAWMLERARPGAGATWALMPLPAIEAAISGHLEGIGVLFLVAAITTRKGHWAWFGAMIKLLPGVLLALEPRRRWVGWALATIVVCLPIVRPTGFETYRATWAFNGSIFPLLEVALGASARPLAQVLGALVVAWILLRSRDHARVALWATGAFVVLSPTVHPWYVLWAAATASIVGMRAWGLLAALVPLSYVVLATRGTAGGWSEWVGTRWLVYTPFYVALAVEAWRRATRAGPSSVG